jgi:8-oxo-dGTP diphosphatase
VNVKVRAVIWEDGRLAIVRERRLGRTRKLLPGGRVKRGEAIADALIREIQEEVGIAVQPDRLLYVAEVFAAHKVHEVNLVFLAVPSEVLPSEIELVDPLEVAEGEVLPPILGQIAADAQRDWEGAPRWLGNVWDSSLAAEVYGAT